MVLDPVEPAARVLGDELRPVGTVAYGGTSTRSVKTALVHAESTTFQDSYVVERLVDENLNNLRNTWILGVANGAIEQLGSFQDSWSSGTPDPRIRGKKAEKEPREIELEGKVPKRATQYRAGAAVRYRFDAASRRYVEE